MFRTDIGVDCWYRFYPTNIRNRNLDTRPHNSGGSTSVSPAKVAGVHIVRFIAKTVASQIAFNGVKLFDTLNVLILFPCKIIYDTRTFRVYEVLTSAGC